MVLPSIDEGKHREYSSGSNGLATCSVRHIANAVKWVCENLNGWTYL